jgi:hypothetical protein
MAQTFLLPNNTVTATTTRTGVVKIGSTLDIQADGTLNLPNQASLTAGTYTKVTVDAQGRVTSASNPTTLSGYGITDAAAKTNASILQTATITSATTLASGADANKVFTVQSNDGTPVKLFTVAQTGLTTLKTNVNMAAGTATDEAFRIESLDSQALFQVMTNGDAVIGGVIKVKGTGESEFAGDVKIGGRLTVAEGVTGSGATATLGTDNLTVNGDLLVKGSTTLGDQVGTDNTTVYGYTKVVAGNNWNADPTVNASLEVFRIETKDGHQLFQVMGNGDAKIAGVITVSGTGKSTFAGDVDIAGKLTVAQGITGGTTANLGQDMTITGTLRVLGDTYLGDDESQDNLYINSHTTLISKKLITAGSSSVDVFRIEDSAHTPLFQVMENGDTVIGGILKVNGTGTSTFAGDVNIGGHLTVMQGATINGTMNGNTFSLAGNLSVAGNTYLGDDASQDTTTIKGVTTISSAVTKAAGNGTNNIFRIEDSAGSPLFQVFTNGDAKVGGSLTVSQNSTVTADMTGQNLTVNGNLVVKGDTTLGDATSDNVKLATNLNMQNNTIVNVATPVNPTDAANKQYVDSVVQGLDIKASVKYATTAALPTSTYSSAAKTITAASTGVLSVDGFATSANMRILVKNETTASRNGIYVVTNPGSAGAQFVLTRAVDFDSTADASAGSFIFVEEGTVNHDTGWVVTSDNIVLDTTDILFTQFSGAGSYTAGTGITQTGTVFTLNPATTTTLGGVIVGSNIDVDGAGRISIPVDTAATNNTIVKRDGSGNINTAGVTATTISASSNVSVAGKVTKVNNVTTAGNFGVNTITANACDTQITGTSQTTVATFTPTAMGCFLVYIYFRVVTGATALAIDLSYNDGTGAQTQNIVASSPTTAVGSYSVTPIYINATTGAPIAVKVTAGTANQVYVSTNIVAF